MGGRADHETLEKIFKHVDTTVLTPAIHIRNDNQAAVLVSNNRVSTTSQRLRHLRLRTQLVQDAVDRGQAVVSWVASARNSGDWLTKKLAGVAFRAIRDRVMAKKE